MWRLTFTIRTPQEVLAFLKKLGGKPVQLSDEQVEKLARHLGYTSDRGLIEGYDQEQGTLAYEPSAVKEIGRETEKILSDFHLVYATDESTESRQYWTKENTAIKKFRRQLDKEFKKLTLTLRSKIDPAINTLNNELEAAGHAIKIPAHRPVAGQALRVTAIRLWSLATEYGARRQASIDDITRFICAALTAGKIDYPDPLDKKHSDRFWEMFKGELRDGNAE